MNSVERGAERGGLREWFVWRVVRRAHTITSTNALLWGVAWLIIASMLGWYFRLLPTSAFSFVATGYVSLLWCVVVNLTVWITFTLLFVPLALVRNPKTKSYELFSRMLFAHWPVTIVMLPGIVNNRIAFATYASNPAAAFDLYPEFSVVMTVVTLLVGIWWLVWSYQAYSTTTERNTLLDKVLFVAVFVISEGLSYVACGYVLNGLFA